MSHSPFTITILYDNQSVQGNLLPSHGFSCLIENNEGKILFDTGESGPLLLANMEKLGIKPSSIDKVVLSHEHYDHVGGVASFLTTGIPISIFILPSFSAAFRKKILDLHGDIREVSQGMELLPGIYSTGEIEGPIHEQGLAVIGEKKALFIGGCCHPGLTKMVSTASKIVGQKVGGVLGGFHLCDSEDEEIISQIRGLKELGVDTIIPCHCTGFTGMEIAGDIFGENCINAGVGSTLEWK